MAKIWFCRQFQLLLMGLSERQVQFPLANCNCRLMAKTSLLQLIYGQTSTLDELVVSF